MRKYYFLTVDVESTISDKVADFGAIISDKKGNVISQCAVLIRGIYDNRSEHSLFHNENSGELWKMSNLNRRYADYDQMLMSGARMLANIHAVNRWLMLAKAQYDPILTAYNLPFDVDKCQKTGIDLSPFYKRFCLWSASVTAYAETRKYRQFILDNHLFKQRTQYGNMSYPTNAETMTRFVLGNNNIPDEPHCSLEDIIGYELPILNKLLKTKSVKWLLTEVNSYNWRNFQVKDWYKPS